MDNNNVWSKLKFDPTISLGNIASVLLFVLAGLGAWYDLSRQVAVHKAENDIKFQAVDKEIESTKRDLKDQALASRELAVELKLELRSNRVEIMQELRDLRAEIKKR